MSELLDLKEQEVHILIGCADARDLNQIQIDSILEEVEQFREKNIDVDFHVLRCAGSFITPDVVMDIKRTIENNQRMTSGHYKITRYYVHIQTHGHLEGTEKNYISHLYDINIVPNSPLNCGMLDATTVGIELEKLLIEEHLEVKTPYSTFKIQNELDLIRLLKEVYAYEGHLAGDWIKSIDKLRTHPREQKSKLEKAIRQDSELNRLGIKITAGIQDYSVHALIRLDGGEPAVPFWDEVQYNIRRKCYDHRAELLRQAEKQMPLAGLLCMSDPRRTLRVLAAKYYFKIKGIQTSSSYLPNTIFNISGSGFDLPESPFGPYDIAGFFYAVKFLKLTDHLIMGYDKAQTNRMMQKIKNDPIMNLIVNKFEVNLIPINNKELEGE
ncbi:MAG: hypothetical protein OHK0038_03980 [Flammeovirgaceae bacterium]